MKPEPAAADDILRPLPHALGPEKSILSSILQDPREYLSIAIEEKLSREHFYLPQHATLYGFLLELFEADKEIELVDLTQRLLDRGLLDRVGGPSALADLYTYSPGSGHFRGHLKHVQTKHVGRSLIQISNNTIANVYDSPDEIAETLDAAEREIMAIREGAETVPDTSVEALLDEVIEDFRMLVNDEKGSLGLSSGFEELDLKTTGLRPGDMFVLAARPSMGKTALMMNIVEHVCLECGNASMIFSLEMRSKQLMQRLLFSRAKYSIAQMSRGVRPNKGDLERIKRAAMDIKEAKGLLVIDDTPGLTINQIRAKARRKKRDLGLKFIAIDYLQLIKSKSKQAAASREREIAEISAGIKALAKELEVPILILAQLNRGPEGRTGTNKGVPRMSDLRESGAIEQDADMVGLLYRTAYYAETDEEKENLAGEAKLDLAKNRSGETGSVFLTWIADLMRFESGKPRQEQGELPIGDKKAKKAPPPRKGFHD